MRPAEGEATCVVAWKWVLVGICWCSLWARGQPADGPAQVTYTGERVSPQVWLQHYVGVEFPNSARHFVLYYRSADYDVVLFSFDIASSDLPQLADGRNVFPSYGDWEERSADLPEWIPRDEGYRAFVQKVAALRHVRSAVRRGNHSAEPHEVRLWAGETPAGIGKVCVSIIADKRPEQRSIPGAPEIPVAPLETRRCVLIDSRAPQGYDTSIWERWSLSEGGYREFIETLKTRRDVERFVSAGAERLADRLEAKGHTAEVPAWELSELKYDSEPVGSFLFKGSENMSAVLVAGRAGSVFQCYACTQRNVLVPDPRDTIPRVLGASLPASACEAHYESASPLGGIVFWIRFDLPLRDWVICLARTVTLPGYAEFTPDTALKEYLETGYHTDAPPWWQPDQLQDGLYAQQRTNRRDSSDVTIGFGRLSAESVRVYIGAYSPW